MNRMILVVTVLTGVLLGGCTAFTGADPQPVPVPDQVQIAVRELVRAVDPDAEPRFEGLRCFTGSLDPIGNDGVRWTMTASVPGPHTVLIERVRAAAVDLGWQPMRPVEGHSDLVVADHHRFDQPLEVAVRATRQGLDVWMYEKSNEYACDNEANSRLRLGLISGSVWLTEAQQTALDTTAAAVAAAPRLIADGLGGTYRAHPRVDDPYQACAAGDRSGARWVGDGGQVELPFRLLAIEEHEKEVKGVVAAMSSSWRLPSTSPVQDEWVFVTDVGVGATLTVGIGWPEQGPSVGPLSTTCVPSTGV